MRYQCVLSLVLLTLLAILPGCPVEMKDMAVVDRPIPNPTAVSDACKPMHRMATVSDCSPGTRGPSDTVHEVSMMW